MDILSGRGSRCHHAKPNGYASQSFASSESLSVGKCLCRNADAPSGRRHILQFMYPYCRSQVPESLCLLQKRAFGKSRAIGQGSICFPDGRIISGEPNHKNMRSHSVSLNLTIREEYCGELCRDVDSKDVEIASQCDHTACLLTISEFTGQRVSELTN